MNDLAAGDEGLQSPILKFLPSEVTQEVLARVGAEDGAERHYRDPRSCCCSPVGGPVDGDEGRASGGNRPDRSGSG